MAANVAPGSIFLLLPTATRIITTTVCTDDSTHVRSSQHSGPDLSLTTSQLFGKGVLFPFEIKDPHYGSILCGGLSCLDVAHQSHTRTRTRALASSLHAGLARYERLSLASGISRSVRTSVY